MNQPGKEEGDCSRKRVTMEDKTQHGVCTACAVQGDGSARRWVAQARLATSKPFLKEGERAFLAN